MYQKRTSLLLLVFTSFSLLSAQVEKVEPPNWWAGMKHPHLQLMLYGKNITNSEVNIKYPGIKVRGVTSVENPNYLFVDLHLSPDVIPGNVDIRLTAPGNKTRVISYELKEREEGSSEREGFGPSDVMYLIMPDRFANGNPDNDVVKGMKEGLNRKDPYGRHGGDLEGIENHLEYIAGLGFTAIWLNPVLENDQPSGAYHGYATTDFYRVDRRFGSNDDYIRLATNARDKGIKLIMDMIFNHCGSEHWWMKDMPMDNWINYFPEYTITNHRRTSIQDPYASEYDRDLMTEGWFVPSMPDLNMENPFLATYMIQNSLWWIETAHLAGIRMDTYPYPDKEAMAEWNRRVLKEYPNLNIVGEEWSINPVVVSYWQKGKENFDGYRPEMPSVMDFPLQHALVRALSEEETHNTGWGVLYEMLANDHLYPDPGNLVIFPDNHDMPRFFMQLGMDRELYRLGITYILTTRGIPQIFYGSEILMTHTEGNDHGNIRKDFPGGWPGDKVNGFTGKGLSAEEEETKTFFHTLLNWRRTADVIHSGKLKHFAPENGIYVYFRYHEGKTVMVILNKNREETTLDSSRFREITGKLKLGRDVISGISYDIDGEIRIPGLTPLVLELE